MLQIGQLWRQLVLTVPVAVPEKFVIFDTCHLLVIEESFPTVDVEFQQYLKHKGYDNLHEPDAGKLFKMERSMSNYLFFY